MSTQQYNSPGGHWFILACILPHYGPNRAERPNISLASRRIFWHGMVTLMFDLFFSRQLCLAPWLSASYYQHCSFLLFLQDPSALSGWWRLFLKKITFKSWDARYLSYSCTPRDNTYVSFIPMVGNPWLNISEDTPVKRICGSGGEKRKTLLLVLSPSERNK